MIVITFKMGTQHSTAVAVYVPEKGRKNDMDIFHIHLLHKINKLNHYDLNVRVKTTEEMLGHLERVLYTPMGMTQFALLNELRITDFCLQKSYLKIYLIKEHLLLITVTLGAQNCCILVCDVGIL